MYVCVQGQGLQFKEREQNRPPWKNNTEVKAWNEHVRRGAKRGRRAEPGRAVGKRKGPEAGAGLLCPRSSRRLTCWSGGPRGRWRQSADAVPWRSLRAWRRCCKKEATGGRGVNEQCDWLTMLNSYLKWWKRGKGWGGRKISQETMQSLSRRWWWLR